MPSMTFIAWSKIKRTQEKYDRTLARDERINLLVNSLDIPRDHAVTIVDNMTYVQEGII